MHFKGHFHSGGKLGFDRVKLNQMMLFGAVRFWSG